MTIQNKIKITFTLAAIFIFFNCFSQEIEPKLEGIWAGKCLTDSFPLSFRIHFQKNGKLYNASFSSDEQRALDIPLQKVLYDSNSHQITFALVGDADSYFFQGKISQNVLLGTVTKGNHKIRFVLTKQKDKPLLYTKDDVTFKNDTVVLSGSLYIPNGKKKLPAIIFIHGSGSEQRYASAYFADYFARRGIAALIYDKRGTGKSSGNWETSSFTDLANDAIAGIKLLQQNLNINSNKIGIYGQSQGGSICPMLLNMYPQTAFGISAASAGVSMAESDLYEVQNRFKHYIFGSDYANAMSVMENYIHFALTHTGYDELKAESEKFKNESWYKTYIGNIDTSAAFFKTYPEMGNYNPVEYWKSVKQPCLILKGANDSTSPVYPSFQNVANALKQSGNKNYKIVLFPNTTHGMHISKSSNDFWFYGTPGYCDTIFAWIKKEIIK